MAVSSGPESCGQPDVWWSSWLSSAKEKSINALTTTKRDLAEFVTVLGSDTKAVVVEASANLNKIIVQPSSDNSSNEEGKKKALVGCVVVPQAPYDRCQAELFALQTNTDTYLKDSSDQGKDLDHDFDAWKSTFDIQQHQSSISNLLVSCHHVRSHYSKLVPAKVSYETFWMRYFYKVQRLQKEEKRREQLMARASNRAQEQLQWDEEVEVISNPILLKPIISSHHQRSESSTDSFVCVSEETGLEGERSSPKGAADTESWEYLDSGESASRESSGARLSEIGEEEDVKKGLDRLFKKHGSPMQGSDEDDKVDLSICKETEEGEMGSNLSDWEKWDD